MKRTLIVIFAAFAATLVVSLAQVSARLKLIHIGYAIGEKTRERRELLEENRRLRLEQSLLRSPERVERLARDKLGMVRPDPARIRVVRPDVKVIARAERAQ